MPNPKPKGKGLADQLAEKAVNKAADMFLESILAYIGKLCKEFSGYLCDFDEHVKDLEGDMVELSGTRQILEHKFSAVSRDPHERTKFEVWCKKEKLRRADADKLVAQGNKEDGRLCLGKGCVRIFYGKNVSKCRDRVRSLKDEGEKLILDEIARERSA